MAKKKRGGAANSPNGHPAEPHLCLLHSPDTPVRAKPMRRKITVATYNVHRWTGMNGQAKSAPARAARVVEELSADVIALQEVLRPHGGDDPLIRLADTLGFHVTFAATREHRKGEIGNAILSRWPIDGVWMLDLTSSKLERRLAVAARLRYGQRSLEVVATHLSLADRSRHKQVRSLLDHPKLQAEPAILLGDMNAWRKCRATRTLDKELRSHNNLSWPASFPSVKPVLALDRIYGRGVEISELLAHDTREARRASDHLPIVARVILPR